MSVPRGNMALVPARSSVDFDLLGAVFPDGVAPRAALLELGVSASGIQRRCRPGGPWRRVIPGVVLLHGGPPTRYQLARAALVHAGPGGLITGLEGARRHGVKQTPRDNRIHVLIPHERKVATRAFAVVERTIHLPDPIFRQGLPLAPLPRAIIDAARRMNRLDEVRAMVADAVQLGLCTPAELLRELAKGTTIGSALPRRVLAEVEDGIRSAAEAWGRSLVKRSSLPEPEWNVELRTRTGVLLGISDAWWREVGLAWEIDSKRYHLNPNGYARTLAKHAALTSSGIVVVHTLPSRLRTDPAGVIRELKGAYQLAASCPQPDVTANLWRPAAGGPAAA